MRRIAAVIFMIATPSLIHAQSNVNVTGVLTDTQCGARGANHLHAEHARRSVASGQAKYALYVSDAAPTARGASPAGQLYILESTAQAEQLFAQYAGQRIRITGTVTATPIRRAGHSLAPDAVATTRNASGAQAPVSAVTPAAARDSSAAPSSTAASSAGVASVSSSRVQQSRRALDTTTPVAGVLTISSVEAVR